VRVKASFGSEGAQIVTAFRLVFCGVPHALGNTGRGTAHLVVDADLTLGASLTMIDRHYGHLARHGGEHAIRLLDELNTPAVDVVDARWTLCSEHIASTSSSTDLTRAAADTDRRRRHKCAPIAPPRTARSEPRAPPTRR
jgi:hypothetical protein